MARTFAFGIIGGSGMLGSAIARAILSAGLIEAGSFWISNRGGSAGFEEHPGLRITTDGSALAAACDVVMLCVPPAAFPKLSLDLSDRLVISVMAGVDIARIRASTGARRVVRAMSSPAAIHGLAYSPWAATAEVTEEDRRRVNALFGACGLTDELPDEAQVEIFTALTGPVPGFVALFADCMARYGCEAGIAPGIVDRAIRQLFLAAGRMMAEDGPTPGDAVQEMIDYAGTTAAGLTTMLESGLADAIAHGLDAAVARTRVIGRDDAA